MISYNVFSTRGGGQFCNHSPIYILYSQMAPKLVQSRYKTSQEWMLYIYIFFHIQFMNKWDEQHNVQAFLSGYLVSMVTRQPFSGSKWLLKHLFNNKEKTESQEEDRKFTICYNIGCNNTSCKICWYVCAVHVFPWQPSNHFLHKNGRRNLFSWKCNDKATKNLMTSTSVWQHDVVILVTELRSSFNGLLVAMVTKCLFSVKMAKTSFL